MVTLFCTKYGTYSDSSCPLCGGGIKGFHFTINFTMNGTGGKVKLALSVVQMGEVIQT